MSTTGDLDAEVNSVDSNSQTRIQTASQTRISHSLTVLRNMTALYQSLPLRSRNSEETVRSVASHELSFSSTTPHSINDILARSTRSTSPLPLSLHSPAGRTSLQAYYTNIGITKTPIVRLASPIGVAVQAVPGTGSPSLYWAAAAAGLMSPSLCWNQRGTSRSLRGQQKSNEADKIKITSFPLIGLCGIFADRLYTDRII